MILGNKTVHERCLLVFLFSSAMPVMRKPPEKLFGKNILSKGYGFHTPQDGSVCKIKIISDEANLLDSLENEAKEIIVGDVDEPVECIIEDCIRTMKEEEECYITFKHHDENADVFPVGGSNLPEEGKDNVFYDCCKDESSCKCEASSDSCTADPEKSDKEQSHVLNSESECISGMNTVNETNECICPISFNEVKIQFKLLMYTREPEIWEMSITEKWRRASYHKQKGLELYARGVYQYAFRRFGLTLKYVISLEHDVPSGQEEGMDIKGLKLSCYLNVAACQMRHYNFESVVINSSKALTLQPNNAKALYRRGAAYLQLQEYEKAKEDLLVAQQLEPKNQAIIKQLQILKSHVQRLNQYYASAMKNMFS